MNKKWAKIYLIFFFAFCMCTTLSAKQETKPKANHPTADVKPKPSPQTIIPQAPTVDAKGYILVDANTGTILAGKNIDTKMAPASLTKLMTLYQVAGSLRANRLHLEDRVNISEKAWRMGGSKMFIKVGDAVSVNDLIQGIAVVSGNDACVAIAEQIAGSEESFADLMNKTAENLGMKNTHYTDATGLPNPQHYTTPRDLGLLARAIIIDYPEYYHWYSQKDFKYNGIQQPNRDVLLWRDPSIDGMKTGHTDQAGYCLVSSAQRNGMRLISVIMGSTSSRSRADASLGLLNYGFHFYESKKLLTANDGARQPRIWFGEKKNLPVGVTQDLYVTLPIGQMHKVKTSIQVNNNITAPIKKGDVLGNITVMLGDDKELFTHPLVALENDPKGGFFSRLIDHIIKPFSVLLS